MGKEPAVVDLTPENFKVVKDDTRLWLLNFYTPWCAHCKNLVPELVKAAKLAEKHNIKVGAVDCELPLNGELCDEFDIRGFPTLRTYATQSGMHHGDAKNPRHASDYEGPRDAQGIVDHLVSINSGKQEVPAPQDPSAEQDASGMYDAADASAEPKRRRPRECVELPRKLIHSSPLHRLCACFVILRIPKFDLEKCTFFLPMKDLSIFAYDSFI